MSDADQPAYAEALAAALRLPPAQRAALAAALTASLTEPAAMPQQPAAPHSSAQADLTAPSFAASFGIDPTNGRPRYQLDLHTALALAVQPPADLPTAPERSTLFRRRNEHDQPKAGLLHGFSYAELAIQRNGAGWGLVVHAAEAGALLLALWPLLELRCRQQNLPVPPQPAADEPVAAWLRRVVGDPNRPLDGPQGVPVFLYYTRQSEPVEGESYERWLTRHGLSPDLHVVDPRQGVPFYLLLAGRPGPPTPGAPFIPFSFQYDLDLFWGVGRLCFTDAEGEHRYAGYARYAAATVRAEAGQGVPRDRTFALFGPTHADDRPTQRSLAELLTPLAHGSAAGSPVAERFGFASRLIGGAAATRTALRDLLYGAPGQPPPALLFYAGHGVDLPAGHPEQLSEQGALLCADWPGATAVAREHWFSAADLRADGALDGSMLISFACFSLGCPEQDQFRYEPGAPPQTIAPYPFIAQLPQRLLEQGVLAVLGHVDRAWSYSFHGHHASRAPGHTQNFEDLIGALLDGRRIGEATDRFAGRQGRLGIALSNLLDAYRRSAERNPLFKAEAIAHTWVAFQDARCYALLGDPAVRLPAALHRAGADQALN